MTDERIANIIKLCEEIPEFQGGALCFSVNPGKDYWKVIGHNPYKKGFLLAFIDRFDRDEEFRTDIIEYIANNAEEIVNSHLRATAKRN